MIDTVGVFAGGDAGFAFLLEPAGDERSLLNNGQGESYSDFERNERLIDDKMQISLFGKTLTSTTSGTKWVSTAYLS